MKLLLDTHVALLAVTDDPKLFVSARERIGAARQVFVSAITIWEIVIKHALRRGRHDDIVVSGTEAAGLFRQAGYDLLSVGADYAAAVDALAPLHGDPFDRLLVAQALAEPIHLLTRDGRLGEYGRLILQV